LAKNGASEMKFPDRLSKAPLIYALCEIRFPRYPKIADKIPDIQEALRDRYELFEEERLTGINVPQKGQEVSVRQDLRWRFEAADRRSGYILHESSIVYHTTSYVDFKSFAPEVEHGFTTVSRIADVRHFQRIGLRYIDLIESDDTTPAEEFVHERLRGFGGHLAESGIEESISQYVFNGRTNIGQLFLRATKGQHSIPLPPDLLPLSLEFVRQPDPTKVSFFLDTDHFVDCKPATEISKLNQVLRELKSAISVAFRKAITAKAVEKWK
jgi:uncharacterized protein (TIGR04255 family)